MGVSIATILDRKGREVATASPATSVSDVVRMLGERDIGALVVVDDAGEVVGIVSERDVVRQMADVGGDVLRLRVEDVMSSPVHTCTPRSTTDELMQDMTERRIRHLPVCEDNRLVGIVSIGDIVKWRFEELRDQTRQLEDYVAGSY
ncbi:CBS domain-containing protein [Egicoccus sp. AB-alg6-2]|uniref:CBS domain-containing protein n=1 Tax=Egicoccus sp. AB-alg6-2 TaxID=3242692 RepID=UPI00359DFF8F